MYQVTIDYGFDSTATLGPCDTRDEAARLARSWLDAYRPTHTDAASVVSRVRIERAGSETKP